MSTRRSSYRKRQKPPFERFKDHCRLFTAFLFSNIGIILLVAFYTIGGAFMFQAIENTQNVPKNSTNSNRTNEYVKKLWAVTAANISFYDNMAYKLTISKILFEYEKLIVNLTHRAEKEDFQPWSLSASFLYSLTVITTIGYGDITPKSDWGKLMTILYAILGMPLFLLYLSNIGDLLAKSFKWIYSKVCLCRICPGVARRRIIRERRKERQLARSLRRLQRMEEASGSSSQSSGSSKPSDGSRSSTASYSSENSNDVRSSTQATSASDSYSEDSSEIERELAGSVEEITVPLTVCIAIMISYVLFGALLFGNWEGWPFLDGSYFCLISLSSIGFGDFVPGNNLTSDFIYDKDKDKASFVLCAVYLLLGMAVIAMCFNLMQEQVIHNMRACKKAFKACFSCKS